MCRPWRLYQSELWAGSLYRIPAIMARLSELAGSGGPLAELLVEIQSAVELGRQGRRDDALRTLHACDRPGRETVLAQTVDLRGGVLLDLGCPEEIGLPTEVDELASGLAGEDTRVVAFATWLRGDVSPELAITIGQEMASGIRPVRLTHQQVALSGVVALIAVHAGDLEQAEALVERGEKLVGHIGGGHGANFLRVAEASLAVARHDERRAVGLLDEALAEVPMEVLPARSYLNSLPLLHLLIPEVRPMIDRANLGPALTTVQEMARALTAQREEGDLTGAVALPWRRPTLLRVHVAPPHLAELAVAAVIGGVPEAEAVLGELPDLRGLLRWVATVHDGPVAEWAHQRLATLPTRPSHSLRIEVLGGLRLFRDGVQVVDKEWRRERVRQMLCFLLSHPQTTRGEVVTALRPELDEHSASANLRTNLGHLQRVLEPDRAHLARRRGSYAATARAWCSSPKTWRATSPRFDALTEEGRNLEERGVPGGALRATCRRSSCTGATTSWVWTTGGSSTSESGSAHCSSRPRRAPASSSSPGASPSRLSAGPTRWLRSTSWRSRGTGCGFGPCSRWGTGAWPGRVPSACSACWLRRAWSPSTKPAACSRRWG